MSNHHRVEFQQVFTHTGDNAEFVVVKPNHLATYFGEPFEASVAVQLDFLTRTL